MQCRCTSKLIREGSVTKPNQFELRAVELDLNGDDADRAFEFYRTTSGFKTFGIQIFVDGMRLEPSASVDFMCLLDSVHGHLVERSATIFTCGCGHSGCAFIDDTVQVSYQGGLVTWRYPSPLVTKNRTPENPFGEDIAFRFLRSEMVTECKKLIQFIRDASGNDLTKCRVPVFDKPLSKLLGISRFKWARRGM